MARKHVSEALAAKLQLLALLRSQPKVLTAFGLPTEASDDRVMRALAKIEGAPCFAALREAGMSLAAASEISERLSLALQAGSTDTKKKSTFSTAEGLKVLIAISLITLFVLVGVVVWSVTQSTRGWELGACEITMFTNGTCVQPKNQCNVELKVQRQGGGRADWYVMGAWALPTAFSTGRGGAAVTRFYGEPLRCCNNADNMVRECCDLIDDTSKLFCDNWPERRASDGAFCPRNRWPCLFKVDESLEGYASAVKPYTAPEILPYVIAIGVICFGLLTGGVSMLVRRCGCRCRCLCAPCDACGRCLRQLEADSDDESEDDSSKQRAKLQRLQNKARSAAAIRGVVSYRTSAEADDSVKELDDESEEEEEQESEEALRSAGFAGTAAGRRSSVASSTHRPSVASSASLESPPDDAAGRPSSVESRRRESQNSRGSTRSAASKQSAESRGGKSSAGSEWSVPGAVASDAEGKLHPLFKDGDLSRMECMAQMTQTQCMRPIIEPVKVKPGKHQHREKTVKGRQSKTVG